MEEFRLTAEALAMDRLRGRGWPLRKRQAIVSSLPDTVLRQLDPDAPREVTFEKIMEGYRDSKAAHEDVDEE